ncbi:NAD-dependent succinate-semialdehyde dehydrogenase [Nocardioides sp. KR10-350]|uniref:NAD-dependent succinate-semialdehyde dehydrogenase n=1 Tax=Nocardioides cheoyonin TaxID=3156615 RepID=UPI0032B35074
MSRADRRIEETIMSETLFDDLYVGGKWIAAGDGERFAVADPATGGTVAMVASGTTEDAIAAVAAAAEAGPLWASAPPRARGDVLRRAYEAMIARRGEIARLIVLESGKSWADAIGEADYAAGFFRWYAEEAVRIRGQVGASPAADKQILALQEPVGVSVLVTPWNFPAAMATRKIGPALAAGCTVVLKPASDTPLTALLLADLLAQAGAPAGVVNVVPSRRSGPTVAAMLGDPRVRKLSFTGSTEVGQMLLRLASDQVLNCSMELGGNAPFLVFDDADLETAVEGALVAKMRNGGESCIAANRFLVHESIAADFGERFAERMSRLRVGPGMDPHNEVGPLINEPARAEIAALVRQSIAGGARLLTGGAELDGPGWFFAPTVLADVPPQDPILRTEIFGPVAPICTFGDEAEAIARANNTEFGLASYVFSRDVGRALRVAYRIEAGVVGINRGFVSDPAAPFGGMKQSGLGREGGAAGITEFLETKYVAVNW